MTRHIQKQIVQLLIYATFIVGHQVWAEEKDVASHIAQVTVFQDRALVQRTIKTRVEAGDTTLVIRHLPTNLITHSLRVKGTGDVPITIGSVESKKVIARELVREEEKRLAEALETLRDKKKTITNRINALRTQLKFIESLGQSMPNKLNEELLAGKVDPAKWREASQAVGSGAEATYKNIQEAEIAQRQIDKEIQQKEKELMQIQTGRKETVQVRINLAATQAGSADLSLEYQVYGAHWSPLYDARLSVEDARVSLVQMAQVTQFTGEDWSNVQLTLSTAQPSEGAQIPEVEPWFIDFVHKPKPVPQPQPIFDQEMPAAVAPAEKAQPRAARKPAPVQHETAQAVAGEFSAEYKISGVVSVPADNSPHKFTIKQYEFAAQLGAQAVPKRSPRAYLYARLKYNEDIPLLPGSVAIFRDNAYITNTHLKMLQPGESMQFPFGVDDKVEIEFQIKKDKRYQEGLINKTTKVEREYSTTVTNHHKRNLDIVILDQIPNAKDERISIKRLENMTPPTKENYDDKEGVLAWQYDYKANEKKTIKFGYTVEYPRDQRIMGFE
jgi:uncharacterized protein (TIGR02231 family)